MELELLSNVCLVVNVIEIQMNYLYSNSMCSFSFLADQSADSKHVPSDASLTLDSKCPGQYVC